MAGEVTISGAKNGALPILAASLCFSEPCVIRNCPNLTDVDAALEILTWLGAGCIRSGSTVTVDPRSVCCREIPGELTAKMRGSLFFLGALMARFGSCRIHFPGGCPLGDRPFDYHLKGLHQMGANIRVDDGIHCAGPLKAAQITLPYPSVGATENLILAALGAEGETLIRNTAREPEICCLCDFLRSGGCTVTGDGTDTIRITGGLPQSGTVRLIPDRMEAATYHCACAGAGGSITLLGAEADHLEALLDVLRQSGCRIEAENGTITIAAAKLRSPGEITTGPYPAFPTDAQAPLMAALLRAEGTTVIHETVFDRRMHHVPALRALGGRIQCRDHTALVTGVPTLHGGQVHCTDLRGGAALVIAGLAATDETEITGLQHLLRGYEDIAGKLRALGAEVRLS